MFRFHDVPTTSPAPAGVQAGSEDHAYNSITGAWLPFHSMFPDIALLPAVFIAGGTTRLSRGLFIDVAKQMTLSECKAMMDTYFKVEFGLLGSRARVGRLPTHHRGIAAQLISSPASISAAQRNGYQFFANKQTLNALMTDFWVKPWVGKGPDFLMSGPKGSAFMEVKGSTTERKLYFKKFCTNKAQSVNAELRPFGGLVPTRHILSQVFAPPSEVISVHWFNQDQHGDRNQVVDAVVLLATGLAQFVGQIENAGYNATSLLAGTFTLPEEARKGHGFVLAPHADHEFTIGVSYAALRLFSEISTFFVRLRERRNLDSIGEIADVDRLSNRLLDLRSFFGSRDSAWRRLPSKPIYTYSTGIFVLSGNYHGRDVQSE